jgi:hypothetical protein
MNGANYSAVTKTLNKFFKGQLVEDGVYDISNIEHFDVQYPAHISNGKQRTEAKITEDYKKLVEGIEEFVAKHPNACLASAYETESYVILSEKPTKVVEYKGSGFSHGSTNIIDNCPSKVLILQAEKEIFIPKPKDRYGAPIAAGGYDDEDGYDDGDYADD